MKQDTLHKKLNAHFKQIDKQWFGIVKLINEYKEVNPDCSYNNTMGFGSVESNIDGLAFKYAWIVDRLDGKQYSDKRTMRRKVRKLLGFTYP
jgi:hypothetical protein